MNVAQTLISRGVGGTHISVSLTNSTQVSWLNKGAAFPCQHLCMYPSAGAQHCRLTVCDSLKDPTYGLCLPGSEAVTITYQPLVKGLFSGGDAVALVVVSNVAHRTDTGQVILAVPI